MPRSRAYGDAVLPLSDIIEFLQRGLRLRLRLTWSRWPHGRVRIIRAVIQAALDHQVVFRNGHQHTACPRRHGFQGGTDLDWGAGGVAFETETPMKWLRPECLDMDSADRDRGDQSDVLVRTGDSLGVARQKQVVHEQITRRPIPYHDLNDRDFGWWWSDAQKQG